MQSLKAATAKTTPAAKLVPNNRWNTATPVTFSRDPEYLAQSLAAKVLITFGTLVSA